MMKPIIEERARANSVASGENFGKGSQKSDEPIKTIQPIRTDTTVADMAGVSRDTVWKVEARKTKAGRMKDKQIWEEGSKLMANPKVSQRVRDLAEVCI